MASNIVIASGLDFTTDAGQFHLGAVPHQGGKVPVDRSGRTGNMYDKQQDMFSCP